MTFLDKVAKDLAEAGSPFESRICRPCLWITKIGKRQLTPSLPFGSVLRMRVEKAEVPFYTINFVRPAGILSSIAGLMLFLLNLEQGRGSMI